MPSFNWDLCPPPALETLSPCPLVNLHLSNQPPFPTSPSVFLPRPTCTKPMLRLPCPGTRRASTESPYPCQAHPSTHNSDPIHLSEPLRFLAGTALGRFMTTHLLRSIPSTSNKPQASLFMPFPPPRLLRITSLANLALVWASTSLSAKHPSPPNKVAPQSFKLASIPSHR